MKLFVLTAMLLAAGMLGLCATPEAPANTQMDDIMRELRQIRLLLEKLTAEKALTVAVTQATQVSLPLRDNYAIGNPQAPVTMVEFVDYQCPFCRRYVTETFPQLKKDYIDTGKVRYISRHYPLPFHPQSMIAAKASLCAGDQGRYWEYHAMLFANNIALQPVDLQNYARVLGLDVDRFTACLNSTHGEDAIKLDMTDADAAHITGTPYFVVGRTEKGTVLNGHVMTGALPYVLFDNEIKSLLAP